MNLMNRDKLEYVEEFGVFFEGFGGSRMLGRVLGALLVSEPPELSAEELAKELKARRGSISQATRTLERMGMVRRLSKPGERRDYFRVKDDAWEETTRQAVSGIGAARKMAEKGLSLLDPETPDARASLEQMRDFYDYWQRVIPEFLDRWDQEKKGG